MKAIRKQNEIDYIIFKHNVEEVEEFLKSRNKRYIIIKPAILESIEEAKEYFKDDLIDEQIHGKAFFDKLDSEGEWYYTKEGKVLLKANINWDRYDKKYYFIDSITIKVKQQLPFEEPEPELYINDRYVNQGSYIVYNEIFEISVLNKESFERMFNVVNE